MFNTPSVRGKQKSCTKPKLAKPVTLKVPLRAFRSSDSYGNNNSRYDGRSGEYKYGQNRPKYSNRSEYDNNSSYNQSNSRSRDRRDDNYNRESNYRYTHDNNDNYSSNSRNSSNRDFSGHGNDRRQSNRLQPHRNGYSSRDNGYSDKTHYQSQNQNNSHQITRNGNTNTKNNFKSLSHYDDDGDDDDDDNNNNNNNNDQSEKPQHGPKKHHSSGLQLNSTLTVDIIDLTHEGQGVAKIGGGFPIFIKDALPGENVQIEINNLKKTYGHGDVLKFNTQSPSRQKPPCEYFDKCGGCSLQHMAYSAQLEWKQKMIHSVMTRIGHLKDVVIKPVIGMVDPFNYRNKVQIPISTPSLPRHSGDSRRVGDDDDDDDKNEKANARKSNNLISGFFSARSHDVIDISNCLISPPEIKPVLTTFTSFLNELNIIPYDENTHTGTLRHIVIRKGTQTDQLMLVMVTKTQHLPHHDKIVLKLRELFPKITSIYQNINSERTNTIMGPGNQLLWGKETIQDGISRPDVGGNTGDDKQSNEFTFEISPHSFFQVNPIQTRVLYQQALEYADLIENPNTKTVIDAYCGVGTISLFMAPYAKRVFGVEVIPDAIQDAKFNARRNGLDKKTHFEAGRAENVIPFWYNTIPKFSPDVLVVDPPRKGCDEALLSTILDRKPPKIVYVSCNPSTLARDLKILEAGGYQTKEIQPVDMFPHTFHCEAVAVLDFVGK
jgi:23S rRNA (uracil1939-C5)-methyltransferase